ncbi:glycosyltransferase family 4 protein [Curtobacterium sp. MCBD17_021]|uniref:glycosyltransferase family 4 protein n=1 Tax=Curtobacterium sp. MCBD17_021 TaxID=2175665 RepID=UPI000DAA1A88|nr:glycosyltransferase family 4 protein [Curtobacterium sp. MCBD17_021]PZE65396.1 glycosyltransferase WbuB [Curtobacterium sp. MCBD17_021]
MKKRQSVLMVGINYAPESTGIAPYSAGLARELVGRGFKVRVISSFPHYPQWSFGSGRPPRSTADDEDGVRVVRRRHRLPMKPGGFARAASEISFGLAAVGTRFGRPDVVVLVSPALLASAVAFVKVRLRTVRRTPVVIWVQDLYSLGLRELSDEKPSMAERIVSRVERWVLRSADAVVVIHERFRDTVVNEMGVDPELVTVVRNWSHMEAGEQADRQAARRELGWSPEDFIVLHAGNMGLKQGLENVVEAARLADATSSRVRFVLMGDGNQRVHLAELGTDVAALSMIGSLPDRDFRNALGAADALLVNERSGVAGMAVPSKLTSYFSTGLPVIGATDPGSVTESEILLAGAGPVVPAGDPRALLDVAEQLAAEPDVARRMGQSGLRFRSTRLTPRASFDIFTGLLRGLATSRSASSIRESGNG